MATKIKLTLREYIYEGNWDVTTPQGVVKVAIKATAEQVSEYDHLMKDPFSKMDKVDKLLDEMMKIDTKAKINFTTTVKMNLFTDLISQIAKK